MVNANTGKFDPRHLYGTSNQDVFRWPGITLGVERQALALFVVSLVMPGAPLLFWGEEQAFYVLENSNQNYGEIFLASQIEGVSDKCSVWSITDVVCTSMATPWLLHSRI